MQNSQWKCLLHRLQELESNSPSCSSSTLKRLILESNWHSASFWRSASSVWNVAWKFSPWSAMSFCSELPMSSLFGVSGDPWLLILEMIPVDAKLASEMADALDSESEQISSTETSSSSSGSTQKSGSWSPELKIMEGQCVKWCRYSSNLLQMDMSESQKSYHDVFVYLFWRVVTTANSRWFQEKAQGGWMGRGKFRCSLCRR